jgi:hypothetical protein
MQKNATKCNETLSKWCKNKHGASKIIDMFETYHTSKSISSHGPGEAPDSRTFHPDGEKRPSRAPGSLFFPEFGPSSIRRAQAIPGPSGHAQGLWTREKRERARSVDERTRKPYNLVGNLHLPPLIALSLPAPPLANPPAGCLNSAVPPPTSPHQPIF